MIRSNPTAIPLRANDIKMLQAEIDKRKATREALQQQQQQQQQQNKTTSQAQAQKEKEKMTKKNKGDEIFGLGDERRDRQGRSLADRIGL